MNKFVSSLVFVAISLVGFSDQTRAADEMFCPMKFTQLGFCAEMTWIDPPVQFEDASLQLKFWKTVDSEGAPIPQDPPVMPFVKLEMPSMGHGSAPTRVKKTAVGVFEVSKVLFYMEGEWIVRFQFLDAKANILDEVVLPFLIEW